MTVWSEGFIEANGLKVFYHRSGSGSNKPAILLLHGFSDNGACWSPVAHDLQETYDVIMPDARGHGRTEGPINDLGTNLLAADAAAIIQALSLKKPYLFGHSMGAATAVAVAANYPELVKAMVLEDPPFMDLKGFTPPDKQQLEEMKTKNLAFHDLPLEERIARGRAENPDWLEAEIVPWAASKGEYNPEIMEQRMGIGKYPWREVLPQVECPTLLITAEVEKGAIITPEVAQEVQQLSKHAEVAYFEGAGHCIHRDRYAETMQPVLDWLRQH